MKKSFAFCVVIRLNKSKCGINIRRLDHWESKSCSPVIQRNTFGAWWWSPCLKSWFLFCSSEMPQIERSIIERQVDRGWSWSTLTSSCSTHWIKVMDRNSLNTWNITNQWKNRVLKLTKRRNFHVYWLYCYVLNSWRNRPTWRILHLSPDRRKQDNAVVSTYHIYKHENLEKFHNETTPFLTFSKIK